MLLRHFSDRLVAAGTNKHTVATANTAKLDRETEELRHEHVPLEVAKLIQQGRQSKGLTQKELATVGGFSLLFVHGLFSSCTLS
jgi:ribosome-binding protein aMBF1 (putative translation factor)